MLRGKKSTPPPSGCAIKVATGDPPVGNFESRDSIELKNEECSVPVICPDTFHSACNSPRRFLSNMRARLNVKYNKLELPPANHYLCQMNYMNGEHSLRTVFTATLFLLLLFPGCSKKSTDPGSGTLFTEYPTKAGTTWSYERKSGLSNIRLINSSQSFTPEYNQWTVTVTAVGPLKLPSLGGRGTDSVQVARFAQFEYNIKPNVSGASGIYYFETRSTGFFLHGFRGGAGIIALPRVLAAGPSYRLNGHTFRSMKDESSAVRITSL